MLKQYLRATMLITLLLFITISIAWSDAFKVKVVYFQPTDAADINVMKPKIDRWMTDIEDAFIAEMRRNGYNKRLTFIRENNKIKVYHVKGEHNVNHYKHEPGNKISAELPWEFRRNTDWDWQDCLHVIIVGNMNFFTTNWTAPGFQLWGIGFPYYNNRHGGECYIAGASRNNDDQYVDVIFHEMLHGLGLYHKQDDPAGPDLKGYEARWLSEHHLFNDEHGTRGWNKDHPKVDLQNNVNPEVKRVNEDIVNISHTITAVHGLHQAYIFRSDLLVLDAVYFDGELNSKASFDVEVNKISNNKRITISIMDKFGNTHMSSSHSITIPAFVNKNPDLELPEPDKEPDVGPVVDEENPELSIDPKNKLILIWAKLKE